MGIFTSKIEVYKVTIQLDVWHIRFNLLKPQVEQSLDEIMEAYPTPSNMTVSLASVNEGSTKYDDAVRITSHFNRLGIAAFMAQLKQYADVRNGAELVPCVKVDSGVCVGGCPLEMHYKLTSKDEQFQAVWNVSRDITAAVINAWVSSPENQNRMMCPRIAPADFWRLHDEVVLPLALKSAMAEQRHHILPDHYSSIYVLMHPYEYLLFLPRPRHYR
ncbi:MAG: hypothetical protein P4L69_11285 [Desulfosporosinus sp.]|nr:hypothetical protein [Desulfosporosinus sp.]